MSSIGSNNAQNPSVRTCDTTGLKWAMTKVSTESKLLLAKTLAKTCKGRYALGDNRFVCTGEFLSKSLSLQESFVAATSRTTSNCKQTKLRSVLLFLNNAMICKLS